MSHLEQPPPPAQEQAAPPAQEQAAPPSRRRILKEVLLVFGLATVICAVLFQLSGLLSALIQGLHAVLIAAVFLYLPTYVLQRRGADLEAYGLRARPIKRGLFFFALTSLVIFPLFAVGFLLFYRTVCAAVAQGLATPRVFVGLCRRFAGGLQGLRLRLPPKLGELVLAQVVVVALPEEYFFRGYVQSRLELVWPNRRRLFGQPVGPSILAASVLFALGHVLVDFNPLRLAVFFPSLVFGWLRSATGSILASVLFHACSNLVSEVLHRFFF